MTTPERVVIGSAELWLGDCRDDPMLGHVPVRTTTKDERGQRNEISVADALDMYAFIQRFAAEKIGCYVPDPDPMWREKAREAA